VTPSGAIIHSTLTPEVDPDGGTTLGADSARATTAVVAHASGLNQPVVGGSVTPSGGGWWEVAGDGGIFTFGDAGFQGSPAGARLAGPIVGMAATSSGAGYWIAGSDGSVYTYGDAPVFGAGPPGGPVVGIVTQSAGVG
jgi:hypothetical protein